MESQRYSGDVKLVMHPKDSKTWQAITAAQCGKVLHRLQKISNMSCLLDVNLFVY